MPQRKQTAPSAVSARFSPASSLTTSSRASMDSKLEDEPRRARTSRFTRTLRPRRSTPLPQRADRSASRHRAGNSTRRWKRRSPHRTDEGSESPPSASRRGGMPPGRVLDSRSAAAQQGMRSRWHCWGPAGRPVGADNAHKEAHTAAKAMCAHNEMRVGTFERETKETRRKTYEVYGGAMADIKGARTVRYHYSLWPRERAAAVSPLLAASCFACASRALLKIIYYTTAL